MTTLDVALRLRLINQLSAEAVRAARDLAGIKTAARGLDARGPDRLKRDMLDVATASRQAGRGLQELRREASALGTARGAERLKRDLIDVSSAARQAERSLAASKRAARQLRDDRGRFASVPLGASASGVGATFLGGSRRMLGYLGGGYLGYRTASAGVRTVVDQDKAWAEVRKKVNNATGDDFATLNEQLRGIARKYGLSIAETYSQAAEAGAAGIDKSEIGRFVELTTRASVGWDTTARETAQKLAEIKSGTGLTLAQIDDLANKINALGDNSAAKERDIVEMFHRSGAAAKKAGLAFEDTLAIMTAVRSTGMQEEITARWFSAFAFDLAGAHTKGKKVKEAWKLLGFDPQEVAKGMKSDAAGTVIKVLEAINKLEQMKQIEVLSKIFGQGWQDETARAAQAVTEIRKQLDFIRSPKNWQGSLQQNLAIQQETIANRWERVKTAVSEIANEIDRATRASKAFNAAIDWLLERFEASQKRRKELDQTLKRQGEEVQQRGEAPGAQEDRLGPAVERRHELRLSRELDRRIAEAERTGSTDLEELRLERAERLLRAEALAPRPPLDLRPSPEALPARPERLRRSPADFPPVQGLDEVGSVGQRVQRALDSPAAASIGKRVMEHYSEGLAAQGEAAIAVGQAIMDRLKAIFDITMRPTISPRFVPAPGGSESPVPQSLPGGPAGPAVRHARFIINGPVNFHGIRDLDAAHRELARLQDRDVAEAREGALHDTWSYA